MPSPDETRIFEPAARAALESFPIDVARLSLVSVSENATFRVTDRASGADYVLRLHRPGYNSLEELDSERMWIRALLDAGVSVPEPLRAHNGRDFVSVAVTELGQQRYAGVARWTDGEMLAKLLHQRQVVGARVDEFEHYFEQLGEIVGAMHAHTANWAIPPGFTRHALDADGLVGDSPFWGRFWEHPVWSAAERALVLATRDRLHAALVRLGRDRETYGLIHADLHPGNLVVHDDALTAIDFDDAGFGWHLYDIAVALFNYRRAPERPLVETAFLRGYRSVRPLPDAMVAMLPMFLLIRALAIVGWIHDRPELDRSEYLRANKDAICTECAAFEPPC